MKKRALPDPPNMERGISSDMVRSKISWLELNLASLSFPIFYYKQTSPPFFSLYRQQACYKGERGEIFFYLIFSY